MNYIFSVINIQLLVIFFICFNEKFYSVSTESSKSDDIEDLNNMNDDQLINLLLNEHIEIATEIAKKHEKYTDEFEDLDKEKKINLLNEILRDELKEKRNEIVNEINQKIDNKNTKNNKEDLTNTNEKHNQKRNDKTNFGIIFFIFILMAMSPLLVFIFKRASNKEPMLTE